MNFLRATIFPFLFVLSFSAKALVITETIQFNKPIDNGSYTFTFDFAALGYNHLTDTIKYVGGSYDFLELIDNGYDPDDSSTWESVEFYSHIFEGRLFEHDLSPGLFTRVTSWNKIYECQYYEGEFGDECTFNLDLFGKAKESVAIYTDNLWLGEVKLWIELDRINLPEPSPFILLSCGLLILSFSRKKLLRKFKS